MNRALTEGVLVNRNLHYFSLICIFASYLTCLDQITETVFMGNTTIVI